MINLDSKPHAICEHLCPVKERQETDTAMKKTYVPLANQTPLEKRHLTRSNEKTRLLF